MPQPLVSVIVPAYNAAGFISRCVESITSQSYPELETPVRAGGLGRAAAPAAVRSPSAPAAQQTPAAAALPLPTANTSSLRTATITCCRAAPQTWWLLCSAAMPTLCWLPTG